MGGLGLCPLWFGLGGVVVVVMLIMIMNVIVIVIVIVYRCDVVSVCVLIRGQWHDPVLEG